MRQLCREGAFDPVLQFIDQLEWDGTPRLDSWLSVYLGAEVSELNRAFGRLVLIALIRRQREPGAKFDTMLVLEDPREGTGKSSAVALLAARPDWFTDQTPFGLRAREVAEAFEGKLLAEAGELDGLRNAEWAHVRSLLSRQVDRARPAYGHFLVDRPRRCVVIGTTNDERYLKSKGDHRRFWPVRTGVIDLEALERDVPQLWAEAAVSEAAGECLILPKELWPAAQAAREERREEDDWREILAVRVSDDPKETAVQLHPAVKVEGNRGPVITADDLFAALDGAHGRPVPRNGARLREAMQALGWERIPEPLRITIGSAETGEKTIKRRCYRKKKP